MNLENEKMVLEKKRPEIREFVCNQPVWVRPDNSKEYVPAVVEQRSGNWYNVSCRGRNIRKHVDAIKSRQVNPIAEPSQVQATTQPVVTQPSMPQRPLRQSAVSTPTSTLVSTPEPAVTSQIVNPLAPRVSTRLGSKARVDYKQLNG